MVTLALITLFAFLAQQSTVSAEITHKSSFRVATQTETKNAEEPDELLNRFVQALEDIVKNANNDPMEVVKQLQIQGLVQVPDIKLLSNDKKFVNDYNDNSRIGSAYLPVVQMHGMGDFAKDPKGMVPLKKAISEYLNGTYVTNIQIGANPIADIFNGFIMNLDDQVDYFASVVQSDVHLKLGFNAVGYSQGNLVVRGYIERYNNPPVKNFISMHGPLAGVASFPGCSLDSNLCRAFADILGTLAYHPTIQAHLAQANYFRDPFLIPEFEAGAIFLPDINNEDGTVNATLTKNFESLQSICLVKALNDTVVIPNDSEWFGYFQNNSYDLKWGTTDAPWYIDNWFGLKTLDLKKTLFFNTTDGDHLQFSTDYLLDLVGIYFT